MKNKPKTYLLALALMAFSVSCTDLKPSGEIILQEKKLQDFDKIELQGKFNIMISQQKQNLLTMESYPNILDNLEIKLENRTLSIKEKKPAHGVDFYNLSLGSRQAIGNYRLLDSVTVAISGKQSPKELSIIMTERSKMMGVFDSPKAKIQIRAWAQLNLQGQTATAEVITKDSATIISPYWQVKNLNIDAQQSTYTELMVTDGLLGKLSQKAQLMYYGEAQKKLNIKDKASAKEGKFK